MNPEVSICCLAYNHSKYIRQMLESLVSQKTNFPFEILIHDDASTDDTADIIREYEKKYPDIVKPIYQTENQYSKKIGISITFLYPRAQGKYIALCEGDDYWCDENKLQRQYDFMEGHPECAMCCHAAEIIDEGGAHIRNQIPFTKSRYVDIRNLLWDKRDYIPTASMFFRTENVKGELPEFVKKAPVGDLPGQMNCALNGTVYYMKRVMSVYRTNVDISWTNSVSNDREKKIAFRKKLLNMFDLFDEYTEHKYTSDIDVAKHRPEFEDALAAGDLKRIKTGILKYHYKQLPLKSKLALNIKSIQKKRTGCKNKNGKRSFS